jgi:glycine/D-amino acid oxidase-like deaminating enzyme
MLKERENLMKRSADVLIIGGGIIGCSIAYFLRKQGVEVIVLEKGEIGHRHQALQQDCWRQSDPSPNEIRSKHSNLLASNVSPHSSQNWKQ